MIICKMALLNILPFGGQLVGTYEVITQYKQMGELKSREVIESYLNEAKLTL